MRSPTDRSASSSPPPWVVACIADLTASGLKVAEARCWSGLAWHHRWDYVAHIHLPADYRAHGIEPVDAYDWYTLGIPPERAADYAANGWTPTATYRLRHLLLFSELPLRDWGLSLPMQVVQDETDWIESTLPPHRMLTYHAAGIHPRAARVWERKRLDGDPTVEPAIETMTALRRGPGSP